MCYKQWALSSKTSLMKVYSPSMNSCRSLSIQSIDRNIKNVLFINYLIISSKKSPILNYKLKYRVPRAIMKS